MRVAGLDHASGAKGGDRFACAIASLEGGIGVLEALRFWAPPFSPTVIVQECAAWVKSWGLTALTGDGYGGELIRDAFRQEGVRFEVTDRDRSAFYLALLPLVNAGRVRLLDHPELLRELRVLERRVGKEGRDRVDHRRGAHDDVANAAAIALVLATERGRRHQTTGYPVSVLAGPPAGEPHPALVSLADRGSSNWRGAIGGSSDSLGGNWKRGLE